MLFTEGEKVHVAERRGFESDLRRHFVDEVTGVGENAILVRGRVFVYDGSSAGFHRHPELRTRIISLVDARMIINVISNHADLEATTYQVGGDGSLVVTDGENFSLAVSEFSARR